jgi:tetratricopeptide (TPR) repeat protein
MRAELEEASLVAEDLKQPAQRWYVAVTRALLALFEGRLADAEDLIERALHLGEQAQTWEALVYYRIQMFGLRSAEGRLEEIEETLRQSVDQYPRYPVFRCILASVYSELQREAECRFVFEGLAANDFAELPRDEEWLFGMSLLAPVCAFLGDTRRAALLYDLVAPYADRNALSVPDLSTGSLSRPLGILAAALERRDDATRHFEDALTMNARMGARPWVAHTQRDYAAMLLGRGAPGDRESAERLLALARDGYRQIGMTSWAERR